MRDMIVDAIVEDLRELQSKYANKPPDDQPSVAQFVGALEVYKLTLISEYLDDDQE